MKVEYIEVLDQELVSITNSPFTWTPQIKTYLAACGMPVSSELDLSDKYYYSRSYNTGTGTVSFGWKEKRL